MEIFLRRINDDGTLSINPLILTEQKSYTIGRKSSNEIKIKSKTISKHHCIIHHNENGLTIENLTSKKDLFVNDNRLNKGDIVHLVNNDIVKIGEKNIYELLIKTDGQVQDTSLNEGQNANNTAYQAGIITVKSERISTENRVQDHEETTIPLLPIIKNEPNQINITHEHYPNQQTILPSSQISYLHDEMQISIDDNKSLILPLIVQTNSSSITESIVLPLERRISSDSALQQSNSNQLETVIKVENPDIPPTNLRLFAEDPELITSENVETNLNVATNERDLSEVATNFILDNRIVSGDAVLPSELKSNQMLSEIKVENPDIPPTNVTLFAKDPLPQVNSTPILEERIKIENPDIPSTNVTLFAKDPLEVGNRIEGIKVENPDIPSTNVTLFAEDPLSIPETPNTQEGVKENFNISPNVSPFTNTNKLPTNSTVQEKIKKIPKSAILFANDPSSESKIYHRILKEDPTMSPTKALSYAKSIIADIQQYGNICEKGIKTENPDTESMSFTKDLDPNQNLVTKPLEVAPQNQTPLLDEEMQIDIEEHEIKPNANYQPPEINSNSGPTLRIRSDLHKSFDQQTNLNDIRTNETDDQTNDDVESRIAEMFGLENEFQGAMDNYPVRIKEEIEEESLEVEFVEEVRKKRRRDNESFRIKQEKDLEEIDENCARPIKREKLDTVSGVSIDRPIFNSFSGYVKQEPEENNLNYSQFSDCEMIDQKPVLNMSGQNNTSQEWSNSGCSDCTTDDYESDQNDKARVPDDKSLNDASKFGKSSERRDKRDGKRDGKRGRDEKRKERRGKQREKERDKKKESRADDPEGGRSARSRNERSKKGDSDRERRKGDVRRKEDEGGKESRNEERRCDERRKEEEGGKERRNEEREYHKRRKEEEGGKERRNEERRYHERRKQEEGGKERRNEERRYDERRNEEEGGKERRNEERKSDERRNDEKRNEERKKEDRIKEERRRDEERRGANLPRRESKGEKEISQRDPLESLPLQQNHDSYFECENRINSTEMEMDKEKEKETVRDPRVRNYTGARVLIDDECPETRERFARNFLIKPVEKKKINLAEYRNKKKEAEKRAPAAGAKDMESDTVPLTTYRQYQKNRLANGSLNLNLGNLGPDSRREMPRTEPIPGSATPIFNELRTQPQGLRPQVQPVSHSDPRLAGRQNSTIPDGLPPHPGSIPPLSGAIPPLANSLSPHPVTITPHAGPIPQHPGSLPPLPVVPPHPGAVPLHPGAVPLHPGAVPLHPGGVPPHQGAVPPHPGAVPLLPNQIQTSAATPYPVPPAPCHFPYMFGAFGYPGMYQYPFAGQAIDPRMFPFFPMSFPMNMDYSMPGGSESATSNTVPETQSPKDVRPPEKTVDSPLSKNESPKEHKINVREPIGNEEKNYRTATWLLESLKNNSEKIKNPLHKSRHKDGHEKKREKSEKDKYSENHKDRMKVEEVSKKVNESKIVNIKPPNFVEQFESEDLGDELLMKIFSWGPIVFEKYRGRGKNDSPISSLNGIAPPRMVYDNYSGYRKTFYDMILLQVSIRIQEGFNFEDTDKVALKRCRMLPNINQKIGIKGTDMFLVPLYVKINVPIEVDCIPPSIGDLLLISMVDELKTQFNAFGYIEKIVVEEPDSNTWKWVTYLISVRQLKFDIHKFSISEVKVILNVRPFVEKARAISHLKSSPLSTFITSPHNKKPSLSTCALKQSDLVYQQTLDRQQLRAVGKVMNSYMQQVPDICLVEGNAGTGKTNIIVNIIFQLFSQLRTEAERNNFRILVCTSTDSEIDDIVAKVSKGIEVLKMEKEVIKMVVIGSEEGRRERTRELSLSRFAKNHVEADIHKYQESLGMKPITEQAMFIEEQVKNLSAKFREKQCVNVFLQMKLLNKYYHIGKSNRKVKNMTPIEKKELLDDAEITFLTGANLIFSSVQNLSGTVMENFQRNHKIPVCIVDEASEIQELETLKAIAFGGNTLVLMGDQNKQPLIDVSAPKLNRGWENSLFHRMIDSFTNFNSFSLIKLNIQYRMVAHIDNWLRGSRVFGLNTIQNAVEEDIPFPLRPLSIFNLQHTEDFKMDEAIFASTLLHCIAHYGDLRRCSRNISVGVIISDAEAKEMVDQEIENKLVDVLPGKRQILNIEVGTIDKFLNCEKDIILASCIRNKHLVYRAGFQRLYSSFTRAKYSLIIYGRFQRIGKYKGQCSFHNLVDYARKNVKESSVYVESLELRRDLIK